MNFKPHFCIIISIFLASCMSNQKESVTKSDEKLPANWSSKVTYEIFIQSFTDSNGDGIGDFNGATSKLDYLQDLGIEAVWLMPIMESPTYHKYDVTDYKSVHPDYGTLDEFKTFVSEAHKRGISVIIDLIINHSSNLHPWFLESQKGKDNPYRDYYVWAKEEDIKDDMSKRTISHDSDNIKQWHEAEGNEELYYGFFHGGMPDLNYDNPKVLEEVLDIGKFWLSDIGVDGFRMDAAKHIFRDHRATDSHAFWKRFKSGMQAIKSDIYIVGEVWADAQTAAPYSEGLPVLFNFDLAFSILESVRSGKVTSAFISGHTHGVNENASLVRTFIQNRNTFLNTNPGFTDGLFLSNHDQNRAMSMLDNDIEKAKLAASIYLTLPGQPYIYYGEEIGMKGRKPDELIREPFLWDEKEKDTSRTSWIKSEYSTDESITSMAIQSNDNSSILNHYKTLIDIRKKSAALSEGGIVDADIDDSRILSYIRNHDNQSLLVLHNVSDEDAELELPKNILEYQYLVYSSGNTRLIKESVSMPALSTIILAKK